MARNYQWQLQKPVATHYLQSLNTINAFLEDFINMMKPTRDMCMGLKKKKKKKLKKLPVSTS